MRLLVTTQAIDLQDPVLGFFHGWIVELAKHVDHIHIICLREGAHRLPRNVSVHSLGKESRRSRWNYLLRFFGYVWKFRKEYDAIFVHMNQEYVLLAGLFWNILGKRVYLWRNHYVGSMATDIASALCVKVFCTSRHSYTARYRKSVVMPVGIDVDVFKPVAGVERTASLLFLGRIAPSKRAELFIEGLAVLKGKRITVSGDVYGDALVRDRDYRARLIADMEARSLGEHVRFHPGVPNSETPRIYSAHEIYVNCSESGMYDKTIFEAAACGAIVLASSADYAALAGREFSFENGQDLAEGIENIRALSKDEKERIRARLRRIADEHSLATLSQALIEEMRA